jgi:hypothetical protein
MRQMPAKVARSGSRWTYDAPTHYQTGKTTAHTDTYHGRFVKLVPDEQVIEVVEFETVDPVMRGEMTITITLTDADGGTEVVGIHEGLPPGVPPSEMRPGGGRRSRSSPCWSRPERGAVQAGFVDLRPSPSMSPRRWRTLENSGELRRSRWSGRTGTKSLPWAEKACDVARLWTRPRTISNPVRLLDCQQLAIEKQVHRH